MKKAEMTVAEAVSYKLPLKACLIGEPHFYRKVAMVVLPMIIQNTLSNVVNLLDNIMVGQVGTLAMSAVAIVNQLMFVFMLCVWGALAGAGIFGTQFYGTRDYEGVDDIRRMAYNDINRAMLLAMKHSADYTVASGKTINPYTESVMSYLENEIKNTTEV